jgi:hypothetical protein
MMAVAVGRRARTSDREAPVASVQELRRGPARATLSNTESRLRLGDLVEALDRELPVVAYLAVWLAIDLRSTRTSLPRACS